MKKTPSVQVDSPPTETSRPETPTPSMSDLIEIAEAIRPPLRDLMLKTNALVIGLKRQRRQSKTMRTALQSLRAVQAIDS